MLLVKCSLYVAEFEVLLVEVFGSDPAPMVLAVVATI